jgi:hypothetical protein
MAHRVRLHALLLHGAGLVGAERVEHRRGAGLVAHVERERAGLLPAGAAELARVLRILQQQRGGSIEVLVERVVHAGVHGVLGAVREVEAAELRDAVEPALHATVFGGGRGPEARAQERHVRVRVVVAPRAPRVLVGDADHALDAAAVDVAQLQLVLAGLVALANSRRKLSRSMRAFTLEARPSGSRA